MRNSRWVFDPCQNWWKTVDALAASSATTNVSGDRPNTSSAAYPRIFAPCELMLAVTPSASIVHTPSSMPCKVCPLPPFAFNTSFESWDSDRDPSFIRSSSTPRTTRPMAVRPCKELFPPRVPAIEDRFDPSRAETGATIASDCACGARLRYRYVLMLPDLLRFTSERYLGKAEPAISATIAALPAGKL